MERHVQSVVATGETATCLHRTTTTTRGAAHLTDALASLGVDVVSLDWRTDLGEAARRIGHKVSLQGNLDPTALAGPLDAIAAAVDDIIAQGRAARGHIVNLGHGVLPSIPPEGVGAFVQAVQRSTG